MALCGLARAVRFGLEAALRELVS